jgi:hypothetical protein
MGCSTLAPDDVHSHFVARQVGPTMLVRRTKKHRSMPQRLLAPPRKRVLVLWLLHYSKPPLACWSLLLVPTTQPPVPALHSQVASSQLRGPGCSPMVRRKQ